jgi:Tfp pilus assembly protein PilZ
MTDKREFQRYRLHAAVEFSPVQSRISGMTRDVSLGGIFVQTSKPPYDGQKLLVTLRLPDQREFLFRGQVVRTFREPIPRPDQPPNGFALKIPDSESYKRFVQSVATSAPPS